MNDFDYIDSYAEIIEEEDKTYNEMINKLIVDIEGLEIAASQTHSAFEKEEIVRAIVKKNTALKNLEREFSNIKKEREI